MVTRIRGRFPRKVYLAEWREHRDLSAEQMAGRLNIERESYYRWEREPRRITTEKMIALADALNIEPEELWKPPPSPETPPSLDAVARGATAEERLMLADVIRRVLGRAS